MLPEGSARILISQFSGIQPNQSAHNLPVEKTPKTNDCNTGARLPKIKQHSPTKARRAF